jgi:hypothetical protein
VPQTAAEALAGKPEATAAAKALAEALDDEPEIKLPFSKYPTPSEALAGIVETVIDSGDGVDLVAEFEALMKELQVEDALTPQVVKGHINRAERNAMRAHRLYVLTKAQFETYRIHANIALGSMREAATGRLNHLKATKQHHKQITDQDVNDMAGEMFPDEWANINDRLSRSKLTLENLERLAELWQRRSWSLSELNK